MQPLPAGATPRASRQLPEVLLCALVAAGLATVIVFVIPRGGDLAAHLYRTGLVRHGVLIWDNLWFAGQYPLASYSLLYYPLAAVLTNAALGILGAVLAAAIFASIAHREWKAVGRWPARTFAVLLTGQTFTAAYPYDMGLATLLGSLWALQVRRIWVAALCMLLTLGFSPLAFLFLVLVLVALFLRQRRLNRHVVIIATVVAAAGGLQLAVLALLPSPGLVYPYGIWRLLAGFAVAGLGAAVALRGRGGWPLANIFLVWAAATVVAYVVPSPVGHNLIRASVFVFPLTLVAAALADFRPRWLTIAAVSAAMASNVLPYAAMISQRSSSVDSRAAFWQPVVDYLRGHSTPGYRVEVVPTANHWEAYYLPAAGLALARGWYRQLDIADNPALYAPRLTAAGYRAWLDQRGVEYVVLPHLPLEATDAQREAALVRSGAAGLRPVSTTAAATIYRLPRATSVLVGPEPTSVSLLGSSEIAGWVGGPGSYLLRVHYTPYWSVDRGAVCLAPGDGAMTRLIATRRGRFTIRAIESPLGVLHTLIDDDTNDCPPTGGR